MFISLIIVAIFIVILVILSLLSWYQTYKLRKHGISINYVPHIWRIWVEALFSDAQNINRQIVMFRYFYSVARFFNKELFCASVIAGKIFFNIFKPQQFEDIMKNTTVIDKSGLYKFGRQWLGDGLLFSAGEKWKKRRKMLTPAFHFKMLESFLPIINTQSLVLIEKLKEKSVKPYISIVPMISLCTLDIIAETAMGVKINAQRCENSEYVKAVGRVEELFMHRVMYPSLWFDIIFYLTSTGREFRKTVNILHSFTKQVIRKRKNEMIQNEKEDTNLENVYLNPKRRMAFLDLLLYHHSVNDDISEEDIREEVDTFMFEGHDTTAMGISWALYNLGLYKDIQEKVYQELYEIFGDDKEETITSAHLAEMKYLECVLKESLRLFPSVPYIGRETKEDISINGIHFPKGSQIALNIYALHHDPELYPNPEVFDPERFYLENSTGRHPFAYVPFSAGLRNCIGQKFAIMEEKIVIANILRHFRVISLDQLDKVTECGLIVLRPINELRLQFLERKCH